ncbi:TniB family protein [Herbaspirillum rubrisubalbicans M1]|uniref:TniB family NTP-binding protein n=1 Tax=Herbaspirillum rubrisubalbicans TaxID=80842 RepID=UPI00073AA0E6|nr:TniB family NTP-binding protein [Herbaspirillum rubrisubalbicans]ALU87241.1 TniB family protein [Herbaspirillum rubrisubalbicans M1]
MLKQDISDADFYDRLKATEEILIPHTQFKNAVARLQRSIEIARRGAEPRNAFLTGEAGTGKTWLAEYFASLYPAEVRAHGSSKPVLLVPTPSSPTLKGLGEAILLALGDPLSHKGNAFEKRERALGLFKKSAVELVFFDEFHHFLDHAKHDSLIAVTDWLKRFIDDARIPCVLMGLPRCEAILQANEQLRRRFSSRLELPIFSIDSEQGEIEFRTILNEIDKALPTQTLSGLAEVNISRRLHFASNGLLGYLRKLITGAVELMLIENHRTLTSSILEQAFREVIWREGMRELNPFNTAFKFRRLDKPGEPFAISVITPREMARRNSR